MIASGRYSIAGLVAAGLLLGPVASPSGAFAASASGSVDAAVAQERTAETAVADALARLPADTGRIVFVPNLSRVAGRLGEFLAGINRAGMLLGADPVDQLMGLLGFSRHVDRFGAVAIAWVPRADGDAGGPPAVMVLVPSRDAEAFLTTNFEPGTAPGTVRDAAGRELRVRAGEHHVLMATVADGDVLDHDPMGPAAAAERLAALDGPMRAMLAEDDVILFGPGASLRSSPAPMLTAAGAALDRGVVAGPAAAVARTLLAQLQRIMDPATGSLPARADAVAIGLRFDPLGLLGRARVSWREPVEAPPGVAAATADGAPASDPLAGIPGGPMLLVGGWDRSSPVETASLDRAMAALGLEPAPRWSAVPRLAIRVPRHEGGFAGGLLAGGGIRLHGAAAVEAGSRAGGWFELPGWSADVLRDGAGAEAAARWRFTRQPGRGGTPGGAMLAVLAGGPRGLSGPLSIDGGDGGDGAVTATMVAAAADAASPFRGGAGDYADDFAVALMREMRPARAAVEAYVDVAAISRWLAAASVEAPMLGDLAAIQGELPPIGVGMAGDAAGVSGFMILPAPLAAEAWDAGAAAVLEAFAEAAGAPAAADEPAGG